MAKDFQDWDAGLHTRDKNNLEHYGVLGMKWGMRRYQNADGSLTAAGQRHYEKTGEYGYHYKSHATKKYQKKAAKAKKKLEKQVKKDVVTTDKDGVRTHNVTISKKARDLSEKVAKYKNRAKRSAEIDKGEQEYAKNIKTGKALALTLLAGGNTMKGYAQYRAMSKQTGKSMSGKKVMAGIKAYRKGAFGSRDAKAAYIRQDEGKKGLGQKAYKLNTKISDAGAKIIDNMAKIGGGWKDRDNKKKHKR